MEGKATLDDVIKAAKVAQLHDVAMQLPQQYDTLVGERGLQLSGGERQRVAIARCMLLNPSVVLFDEATASLDTLTEQAVLSAFQGLRAGRTTIAIAHRLSTILDADEVLYLGDGGRILDYGPVAELLHRPGPFRTLWELQTEHAHVIGQDTWHCAEHNIKACAECVDDTDARYSG